MPELPEVETIVRNLRVGNHPTKSLVGLEISGVKLLWPRTLVTPDLPEFLFSLPGQKIMDITRRGKLAIFKLTNLYLAVHLRMSGDLWVLKESDQQLPAHARMVIDFMDAQSLVFNDPRKFGRVWLVDDITELTSGLGPEPFDPALDGSSFFKMLAAKHRKLKPLLLDQSFIAGLGNIYTDEALHLAKLHPMTLSNTLSSEAAGRLLDAIHQVLTMGIARNGSSIDWVYRGGSYQNHFRVYGRTDEPCSNCGQPIQRILVGQRGTHFCPVCQPLISNIT